MAKSLNSKVAISLLLLALFLFTILFLLIVPKMQEEKYNHTKNTIEQMIALSKEEIILAGKAITMQSDLEKAKVRTKVELELSKLKYFTDTQTNITKNKIFQKIKELNTIKECSFILSNKDSIDYIGKLNENINIDNIKLNVWQEHKIINQNSNFNKKRKLLSFSIKLAYKDTILTSICNSYIFNKNHSPFEKTLKINIQRTLSLTDNIHKGKAYMMWINKEYAHEKTPLFTNDEILSRKKYTVSNMSAVENIMTGDLSASQIINAIDKEPILHKLNNKNAITWITSLSESEKYYFFLVLTTYEEDFYDNIDSAFWKILPASLISLLLAIVVGSLIFKRLFKGINQLSLTAKEVNNGNKNIRSNVKGSDDIGSLGIAFDNMLDSFEDSIKTLDSNVEEKTKELQKSLKEKDVLLKEIHHRVKNNLALTISLIQLQQAKITDPKTTTILKNIQERIYTMELLHRKLYESSDLDSINFKDYVHNLIEDISLTYDYEKRVEILLDIEDLSLDIETAMPCGLIINEIATNSFKYAFENIQKPKLNIDISKKDKQYKIKIKDNGKGLDKDFNLSKSKSLGLKLIHTISKLQLDGEVSYTYKDGAVFEITFEE